MKFKLAVQDKNCKARAGEITTDHGVIETPIFMPVGTAGIGLSKLSKQCISVN